MRVSLVVAALFRCTPATSASQPSSHESPAGFGEAPAPRPKPPSEADPELHVDTLLIEEIDAQGDVIRSLWVGETEVPMLYYFVCVGTGACTRADRGIDCVHRSSRDAAPINCVSWADADAYCRSHGERLPTEEEWDWIVRVEGGNPWGPDENPCDFAVLQDPEEGRGGVNFYAYVENRPIGAIDPLGLVPHRPYSTEQEAALEAARWIEILLPKDDVVSHEYAGLIYEMGGYFYHTNPLYDPSLGDTHARPGLALGECPASSTPTAGFHSHPPITGYDQRAASEGDRHYVSVATPLYMVTFDSEGRGGGLYGLAQWEGDEYLHWDYHYLEEIWP